MSLTEKYPVDMVCKTLQVSSNAFYTWKRQANKTKVLRSQQLRDLITVIFHENRGLYGAPRIHQVLKQKAHHYSLSYVSRIMKELGLRSIISRKFVVTTDSKHDNKVEKNHLNREFNPKELGKVWVSDITYIRVNQKWFYLTTMIDLADRQVVGWSVSSNMTTKDTVIKAWIHARQNRVIKPGFILHSDRGTQYTSSCFRSIFNQNTYAKQSMSRKGNCWDNAVAESFFKTIKVELFYTMRFKNKYHLELEIFKYMNWYNNHRIHSSLGYKTPAKMQKILTKQEFIKSA